MQVENHKWEWHKLRSGGSILRTSNRETQYEMVSADEAEWLADYLNALEASVARLEAATARAALADEMAVGMDSVLYWLRALRQPDAQKAEYPLTEIHRIATELIARYAALTSAQEDPHA